MGDKKEKNIQTFLDKLPYLKKLKEFKHIGFVIVLIFILILLFILFGNINIENLLNSNKNTSSNTTTENTTYLSSTEYVEKLENKLTILLSKVKGAGNVDVMVSLESGSGLDLAENIETKTTNSNGVETTTVSTTPILIDVDGKESPVIIAEILPKISGVVVVSSGANDINVRMYLISAIQTLLDLPQSKIQILVGK